MSISGRVMGAGGCLFAALYGSRAALGMAHDQPAFAVLLAIGALVYGIWALIFAAGRA